MWRRGLLVVGAGLALAACGETVGPCVSDGAADPEYRVAVFNPGTSPSATFPATGVQDRCGNPVPFRIVSDGRVAVAGTAVGTVEARTVTWDKATTIDPDPSRWFVLELRDAGDALVGRLAYKVYDIGTTGAIQWGAFGVAIDPVIP